MKPSNVSLIATPQKAADVGCVFTFAAHCPLNLIENISNKSP
jgi:hypothetical protein